MMVKATRVDEIKRLKYLPEYIFARLLSLEYVLVNDRGELEGPTFELAPIVEYLVQSGARSILDVFCGTGALSKLALLLGAERVTCVDVYTEAVEQNLKDQKDRIEVIRSDAFNFQPKGNYDLAIIDPPSSLMQRVIAELLPLIRHHATTIVLNLGSAYMLRRNIRRASFVREILGEIAEFEMYGLHVVVHSAESGILNGIKRALNSFTFIGHLS